MQEEALWPVLLHRERRCRPAAAVADAPAPLVRPADRRVGVSEALVANVHGRLAELELVVERGLQTFSEVGAALLEIRDRRLYRETHASFEAYCRERWQLSRPAAYRAIDAARVVDVLSPIGDSPANEAQARELVPLLREGEPELVGAMRELREQYGDTFSAVNVKRVVENRLQRIERERSRSAMPEGELAPLTRHGQSEVRLGDFRAALADLAGVVDAIITDPPYETAWIEQDAEAFAAAAARMLTPAGTLVVLFGQFQQYALKARLDVHLRHRWTATYLMPGSRARMFHPRVATGWKPVLVYTRPDAPQPFEWLLDDVFVSDGRDKDHHHWGQSESGTAALVERFTRPGQLVVDPFLGGGTTAVVCRDLGRRFVGCDRDAAAVTAARARLEREREAA